MSIENISYLEKNFNIVYCFTLAHDHFTHFGMSFALAKFKFNTKDILKLEPFFVVCENNVLDTKKKKERKSKEISNSFTSYFLFSLLSYISI